MVRSDRGTDDCRCSKVLRHKDTDDMKGDKSLLCGRSTANQVKEVENCT